MDDRVFELLTKMYSELTGKIDGLNNKFDGLNKKVDNVSNQLTRLEYDVKKDISCLYDGYKQTYEKPVFVKIVVG